MLTDKIFKEGLFRLSLFFKKTDATKLFADDYYKAIQELTDEQFNRAVDWLIKNHTSPWFPIPSEFLKAVKDSRPEVTITSEDRRIEPKYVPCPPEVKEMMKRFKSKEVVNN